jgi:hypothetical protein
MAAVFAFLGTNFFSRKMLGLHERFLMCVLFDFSCQLENYRYNRTEAGYGSVMWNAIRRQCVCYESVQFSQFSLYNNLFLVLSKWNVYTLDVFLLFKFFLCVLLSLSRDGDSMTCHPNDCANCIFYCLFIFAWPP